MEAYLNKENLTMIDHEMMEVSFNFWFNDHEDIRCPFPDYIKMELRELAENNFSQWASKLTEQAKKEINDEILLERFEEILFETASKLVQTEEERITIKYPFMLRLDDQVSDKSHMDSKVVKREIISINDTSYLKVTFEENETKKTWDTTFEVPE
ncbi:MAG: hypothetical protein IPM51_01605 [Sphingobacteriaceae bacterium]|nr:hypothetical protein [Sphingobacteriaceae bacterium]